MILRFLIFAKTYILKNWSYWFLLRLYRKLSSLGLVVGSSSKDEIEGVKKPNDYFMGASNVQASTGIKVLKKFNKVIEMRKENGIKINEWMQSHNKCHLSKDLIIKHLSKSENCSLCLRGSSP